MSLFPSMLRLISPAACVLPVLLCCGRVQGQQNPAIELAEVKATLQSATTRIAELEAKLDKAKSNVNDLAEAPASANGDAQQARESYERLRIQMEGLGIAALDESEDGLQQRLLAAMSDMRILKRMNHDLVMGLMELSQATLDYAKAAGPVQGDVKTQLDARLAQSEKLVATATQEDAAPAHENEMLNARVVSLKEDVGLAVFNVGARHGVHAGMPFSIYRQDRPVATALVVAVRPDICGAVIRDLMNKNEPVKVGDSCKVDAAKN
jgi:outer membrane murein-binding lipoprotein Lpp